MGVKTLVSILLVASSVACSKVGKKVDVKPLSVEGVIVCDTTCVHIGKVVAGGRYKADFHLRNRGTSTIEIVSLESDCDCMGVESESSIVEPGTTDVVRATYRVPEGVEGMQYRLVTVKTDKHQEMKLCVSAEVSPAGGK